MREATMELGPLHGVRQRVVGEADRYSELALWAPSRHAQLSGPAAAIDPTFPNLNGIEATADGSTLIVNHTVLGALFTVDPATGASASIAVSEPLGA